MLLFPHHLLNIIPQYYFTDHHFLFFTNVFLIKFIYYLFFVVILHVIIISVQSSIFRYVLAFIITIIKIKYRIMITIFVLIL